MSERRADGAMGDEDDDASFGTWELEPKGLKKRRRRRKRDSVPHSAQLKGKPSSVVSPTIGFMGLLDADRIPLFEACILLINRSIFFHFLFFFLGEINQKKKILFLMRCQPYATMQVIHFFYMV